MSDQQIESKHGTTETAPDENEISDENPEGNVQAMVICEKARISIVQGDFDTAKTCIGDLVLRKKYNEANFLRNRLRIIDPQCEESAYLEAICNMADTCYNSYRKDYLHELKESLETGVQKGFLALPEEPEEPEKTEEKSLDEYLSDLDHLLLWLLKVKNTEINKIISTRILAEMRKSPK